MANNEENLRPPKTKEEARERGRNGGIASGKAKRRNKTLKQAVEYALSLDAPKEVQKKMAETLGIDHKDIKNLDAMVFAQLFKAIRKGDTAAFNAVSDRLEGKPKNFLETTTSDDKPDDDVMEMVKQMEEKNGK